MTQIQDIPNELILAIGSHLQRPSHILSFVLVNRRVHSLILLLLYERIAIDCIGNNVRFDGLPGEVHQYISSFLPLPSLLALALSSKRSHCILAPQLYRSRSGTGIGNRAVSCARHTDGNSLASIIPPQLGDIEHDPHGKLARLSHKLSNTKDNVGSTILSMRLSLGFNDKCHNFDLAMLLSKLPKLKCFSLSTPWRHASCNPLAFSPSSLARGLHFAGTQLEHLTLDVDHLTHNTNHSAIGSLRHLTAMKHLRIRAHLIIHGGLYGAIDDSLGSLLPERLETLVIRVSKHEAWGDNIDQIGAQGNQIAAALSELFEGRPEVLPALRDITIYILFRGPIARLWGPALGTMTALMKRYRLLPGLAWHRGIRMEVVQGNPLDKTMALTRYKSVR